jgi:hypothetical protein
MPLALRLSALNEETHRQRIDDTSLFIDSSPARWEASASSIEVSFNRLKKRHVPRYSRYMYIYFPSGTCVFIRTHRDKEIRVRWPPPAVLKHQGGNEDESSALEDKAEPAAIFSVREGQLETSRCSERPQQDSPCERKRHDTSGNRTKEAAWACIGTA